MRGKTKAAAGARPVADAVLPPAYREDAAQLRFIADNVPAMTVAYDEALRCVFANRRYAEFFGFTTENIVGRHLGEVVGEAAYEEVTPYLAEVLRGHRTAYKRVRRLPGGEKCYLEVELIPHLADGQVRGLFSVTVDATQRRREEQLRMLGLSTATLIANAADSHTAIQSVLQAICEAEGWDCGRFHQAGPDGNVMRMVEAWGIDDPLVQDFLERARNVEHRPGLGLVGRAWASAAPLWVADATGDPRALMQAMKNLKLRAAFHFPVRAGGEVIGVLGFNSRERREPDERVLSAVLAIGAQIGEFLQRKRIEDDLRRFRAAMDVTSDMILLIDPEPMRYVDANATACELLGYTREELLQLGPHDVIVDAAREELQASYQRFIRDPSSAAGMVGSYRRKDGSTFPFESTRQALRAGERPLISAISRDISQRVATEQALRESEARFRSLCTLSSDVFWEQDAQFRFTAFSDAFGKSQEQDILGKTRWELGHANMTERDWAAHRAVLEAHEPFRDLEVCRLDGNGEEMWASVSGEPVFDASGAFRGYRGVGRDITARKREERLLRLEHEVARAFDESPDARSALAAAMRAVCETEGWDSGRYLELSGGELRPFCDWCIADPVILHYVELSRSMTYKRGSGIVGAAWDLGEPQWVADSWNDPRILRPQLARETGTRCVFAVPVLALDEVVGVFIFQSRRVRQPDERLLIAMQILGTQIGQLVRRANAEDAMRESEARFRSLCALSSDIFWEQDEHFRFTSISGRTAFDAAWMLGKRRWEIGYTNLSSQEWAAHRVLLDARQPFRDLEFRLETPDGGAVWYSVSGEPMFDADGKFKGYRGVGRDISARRRDEERIRHLANHDALTGLPNRTAFSELLNAARETARRHARSLAVMFVDLDRFKVINDTLGHEVGDLVLCEVARRLRETLRASDVVARLGGDEFVVLIPELASAVQAEAAARKVLAAVVKPMLLAGRELTVTGSIGIALYPQDGHDEQSLMKNADTAMYRAKEAGKNNFKFHSGESDRRALERLAMETSLRKGLERQEFFLHYQPRLALRTGRVTGVEALVRWRHPELGIVPPNDFIPLAEETGTIHELGAWVLREACAQGAAWERAGLPPLHIAVNVSLRQLANEELPAQVAAALEASGFPPGRLEIEITETAIAQSAERAVQILTAIRALGVRIALDDFGTGYSSLSQLRRLPIDTLKVDRAFVAELPQNNEDAAIARAVITMGQSLGLVVVAEGVESTEQRAFLEAHDCDEMQGYLFSRPLSAEDCAAFLRRP